MKKMNKKGFTLAELLIVVAIIAVLVAIAIPVFNTQLEKSRDSVSISNIRAAYAQAQAAILTKTASDTAFDADNVKFTAKTASAAAFVEVQNVSIKSQKNDTAWSGLATELPWQSTAANKPADPGKSALYTIKFTYNDNNQISDVTLTEQTT